MNYQIRFAVFSSSGDLLASGETVITIETRHPGLSKQDLIDLEQNMLDSINKESSLVAASINFVSIAPLDFPIRLTKKQ